MEFLNYLKCMLQLILSPGRGWEDISHEGRDRSLIATRGFYPFIAIVALTCFVRLLYSDIQLSVSVAIIQALVTFIQFFLTWVLAWFIMPQKLTEYIEGEYNEKRTCTFILYIIGLMAMVEMIVNLIPFDTGVTHFLPLYVAIIIWKGSRYMAIKPEKVGWFSAFSILLLIVPPMLIGWLFGMIL